MSARLFPKSPFRSGLSLPGRLSGRQVLVAAVAIILVLVLWRLPSPVWACGPLDRSEACAARVQLESADLGFDPGPLSPGSVAVSPDGAELVVALTSHSDSAGHSDSAWVPRGVLVSFDVATGRQIEVVVESEEGLLPSAPAFSADGSLIAVAVSRDAEGETEWSAIMVIDRSTGERSFALEFDWLSSPGTVDARAVEWRACREGGMRFSLDGGSILCDSVVEIATGDFATAETDAAYLDPAAESRGPFLGPVVGRGRVVGTIETVTESDGQPQRQRRHVRRLGGMVAVEVDVVDDATQTVRSTTNEISYPERRGWESRFMGLSAAEDRVFVVEAGDLRPWLPRALRPRAGFGVLTIDGEDAEGGEIVVRHDLRSVPVAGAWHPGGSWFVLIDQDFVVTRFCAWS